MIPLRLIIPDLASLTQSYFYCKSRVEVQHLTYLKYRIFSVMLTVDSNVLDIFEHIIFNGVSIHIGT